MTKENKESEFDKREWNGGSPKASFHFNDAPIRPRRPGVGACVLGSGTE